jgi:hypothetical protein
MSNKLIDNEKYLESLRLLIELHELQKNKSDISKAKEIIIKLETLYYDLSDIEQELNGFFSQLLYLVSKDESALSYTPSFMYDYLKNEIQRTHKK